MQGGNGSYYYIKPPRVAWTPGRLSPVCVSITALLHAFTLLPVNSEAVEAGEKKVAGGQPRCGPLCFPFVLDTRGPPTLLPSTSHPPTAGPHSLPQFLFPALTTLVTPVVLSTVSKALLSLQPCTGPGGGLLGQGHSQAESVVFAQLCSAYWPLLLDGAQTRNAGA